MDILYNTFLNYKTHITVFSILSLIGYFINPFYSIILLLFYLLKIYYNGPVNKNQTDFTNKVVVITGGLKGIGYQTVVCLARLNAQIIVCGRIKSWREALEAIHDIKQITKNYQIQFVPLDLESRESIVKFITDIKKLYPQGINILINNAGISCGREERNKEGIEMEFAVNHLGHFQLTLGLLELLLKKEQSRIITLSSSMYEKAMIDFEEINKSKCTVKKYISSLVYSNSKLANILFTKYLTLKLNTSQIKCVALHPGVVRTNIFQRSLQSRPLLKLLFYSLYPLIYLFTKSTYYGAQTTVHCCCEQYEKLVPGGYYTDCQVKEIKHEQIKIELMEQLWEESRRLCGDWEEGKKNL